jgi:hypothetical protein
VEFSYNIKLDIPEDIKYGVRMKNKSDGDAVLRSAMEQLTSTGSLQYVVVDDDFPDSVDKLSERKMNNLKEKVSFCCRVHPTDGYHEVGCPHRDWSREELIDAIKMAKVTHKILVKQLTKYGAFRR